VSDSEPSDDALFAAWQGGDEGAFDRLVQRHGPAVHSYLRMVLADPELAADAWSETFLRVVRAADRYVPRDQFRAWLLTIARRCAQDRRRTTRRVLRLAIKLFERDVAPPPPPRPDLAAIASAEERRVRAALMRLSESHRTIVLLTYQQDLNSEEVAQIVGLTAQQVRSRLTYARRLLRAELESDDD